MDALTVDTRGDPRGASYAVISGQVAGTTRVIRIDRGLHTLTFGPTAAQRGAGETGVGFPLSQISPLPARAAVEIIARPGEAPGWVAADGGVIFVKGPEGGGAALVTTYGNPVGAALPHFAIRRLEPPAAGLPQEAPAVGSEPVEAGIAIDGEIVLHIEQLGDRRFSSRDWAGHSNPQLRIEGFSLRPLEAVAPDDVEYMGFYPGGRHTAWISGAAFCGSRGRALPLAGFAVRLAPDVRPRFDVVYRGLFGAGGATPSRRNGEPCLPVDEGDQLCGLRIEIIDREGNPVEPPSAKAPEGLVLEGGPPGTPLPAEPVPVPPPAPLLDQARFEIELLREHFDAKFYAETYPELGSLLEGEQIDPLEHFCLVGWRENRNPVEWFSVWHYRAEHPDVAASIWNPFAHYITYGKGESRRVMPAASPIPALPPEPSPELEAAREQLAAAHGELAAAHGQLAAARQVNQALIAALRERVEVLEPPPANPRRRLWPWRRRDPT